MSGTAIDIARARADALAARARLQSTADTLKVRLQPATIAREMRDTVQDRAEIITDQAITLARARPGVIAGTAAGLALIVLRKPIGRLACRLFRRRRMPDAPAARGI